MLDERKKKILKAIVDDYIINAEPIGSRTIEKKCGLGLSSATIRNEMADLEELGYLQQPHTSAGRVPSISGYRLYVDELMTQYALTMEELDILSEVMSDKLDFIDKIVAKTSKIVSSLTNCTSIVVKPKIGKNSIKNIRLIDVTSNVILGIIITNEGIVKDEKIRLEEPVDRESLSRLEVAINNHLSGIDFSEITMERVIHIVNEARVSTNLVISVFGFIRSAVDAPESDVFVNGQTNVLSLPEFQNVEKAKQYLKFVNDNKSVIKAINGLEPSRDDVNIQIGNVDGVENCSIITSKYKIGDNMEGYIGLIGPVRMDYKKAVSVMKYATNIINTKMNEIDKQGGKDG